MNTTSFERREVAAFRTGQPHTRLSPAAIEIQSRRGLLERWEREVQHLDARARRESESGALPTAVSCPSIHSSEDAAFAVFCVERGIDRRTLTPQEAHNLRAQCLRLFGR
jgi:hypothetical protein